MNRLRISSLSVSYAVYCIICVLLVEKNNKTIYYRGVNMEVSLPTGSLCSERNAIGSALSEDPSLRRGDIKAVAVLTLSLKRPTTSSTNNNPPISPMSVISNARTTKSNHRRPGFDIVSPETPLSVDRKNSPPISLARTLSIPTQHIRALYPPKVCLHCHCKE